MKSVIVCLLVRIATSCMTTPDMDLPTLETTTMLEDTTTEEETQETTLSTSSSSTTAITNPTTTTTTSPTTTTTTSPTTTSSTTTSTTTTTTTSSTTTTCIPSTCPAPFMFVYDSCFYHEEGGMIYNGYDGALAGCQGLNSAAHLWYPTSQGQRDAIAATYDSGMETFYIGVREDPPSSDMWVYGVGGSPVTWTEWGTNQPNGGASDTCVIIRPASYTEWQDYTCSNSYPRLLCQMDPVC